MARRSQGYVFSSTYYRKRKSPIPKILLSLILLLAAAFFLLNYISTHDLEYVRQSVTIPNLPEELEGFAILQLSDLQGAEDEGMVRKIASLTSGKSYSCVVFTGDMVGRGSTEMLGKIAALFPEQTPKLLICGDEDPAYLDTAPHRSLSAYADWAESVRGYGITILDEPYLFTRGKNGRARLWIVPEELYGMDLQGYERTSRNQAALQSEEQSPEAAARRRVWQYEAERMQRVQAAVADMKDTDIQIVLTHVPVTEDYARTMEDWHGKDEIFSLRRVSLILAGHYVAGQWRLPGKGAIYVPERGYFPGDEGLCGFNYPGGIMQYISPGMGTSSIYQGMFGRLFNAPVITSLELTGKMRN